MWVATVGNIDWPSKPGLSDVGPATRAAGDSRSRRVVEPQRGRLSGASRRRRVLCIAVRAVVAVSHGAPGPRARAAVGPARVCRRAGAQARARAARVVQSVSRRVQRATPRSRARTSVRRIPGSCGATIGFSGWIRAIRKCGAARFARSSTSRAGTTSTASTSTTTSIRIPRTTPRGRKWTFPDSATYARYVKGGGTLVEGRLAPRQRRQARRGAVQGRPRGEAVGARRHQPVRDLASGQSAADLRLRRVRRDLRRLEEVAPERLGRLLRAAVVLADRAAAAKFPRAATIGGRRRA